MCTFFVISPFDTGVELLHLQMTGRECSATDECNFNVL